MSSSILVCSDSSSRVGVVEDVVGNAVIIGRRGAAPVRAFKVCPCSIFFVGRCVYSVEEAFWFEGVGF